MNNPLYTEFASEYADAIEDNIFNARFERPSFLSLLPELTNKSVLELGCGPGELINSLIDRGCTEITAVDIAEPMVKIIRQKYGAQVTCYQQDLNQGLPQEKKASYDLVHSSLTIHYIEDLDSLFKEVSRVLRDGGKFIFSTHHPLLDFRDSPSKNYFAREKLTQSWDTIGRPVKVSFYRRPLSSLFNSLTEAGFCVTQLTEGKLDNAVKNLSRKDYDRITTKPWFLFLQCQKK